MSHTHALCTHMHHIALNSASYYDLRGGSVIFERRLYTEVLVCFYSASCVGLLNIDGILVTRKRIMFVICKQWIQFAADLLLKAIRWVSFLSWVILAYSKLQNLLNCTSSSHEMVKHTILFRQINQKVAITITINYYYLFVHQYGFAFHTVNN